MTTTNKATTFEFHILGTPDPESGYQGILEKTARNTATVVSALLLMTSTCGILALGSGALALGSLASFGAGAIAFGTGAVISAALGIIGLAAIPLIAIKDLAHHTVRVILTRPEEL